MLSRKVLFISFFALFMLMSCDSDDDVDDGMLRITSVHMLMKQTPATGSLQGMAIYGKYLFQCKANHANIYVYDLESKEYVTAIALKSNSLYHDNQADFSDIFYSPDDEFPLLYISEIHPEAQNILVLRIQRNGSDFTATQVQEIKMPAVTEENNLFHFNIVMDNPNGFFYLYSRNQTTGMGYIKKFRTPDVYQKAVTISEDEMLDSFPVDASFVYAQGGKMIGRRIFFVQGIPGKSELLLNMIDVDTHYLESVNLAKAGLPYEPEGVDVYRDQFVITTNKAGIYTVTFNQPIL